jgi:hypothetical protein
LIPVSRDIAGIRIAAAELFEESLAGEQLARKLPAIGGAANRERLMRTYEVKRTLAAGYYVRAEYLMTLLHLRNEGLLKIQLMSCDLVGMEAVAAARAEFGRSHPPCPHCGAAQQNPGVFSCWNCNQKIKE